MAYRFDPSTGSFVEVSGQAPVSRRRTSSPLPQSPSPLPPSRPVRPAPQSSPVVEKRRRRLFSRRRSQVEQCPDGRYAYDPETGEFVSGVPEQSPRPFNPYVTPPVAHTWTMTSFGRRLERFIQWRITRIMFYVAIGALVSLCSRLF